MWKTERRIELIEIPDGLARRFITLGHNRPVFFPLLPFGFAAPRPKGRWWRELFLSSRYSFSLTTRETRSNLLRGIYVERTAHLSTVLLNLYFALSTLFPPHSKETRTRKEPKGEPDALYLRPFNPSSFVSCAGKIFVRFRRMEGERKRGRSKGKGFDPIPTVSLLGSGSTSLSLRSLSTSFSRRSFRFVWFGFASDLVAKATAAKGWVLSALKPINI